MLRWVGEIGGGTSDSGSFGCVGDCRGDYGGSGRDYGGPFCDGGGGGSRGGNGSYCGGGDAVGDARSSDICRGVGVGGLELVLELLMVVGCGW